MPRAERRREPVQLPPRLVARGALGDEVGGSERRQVGIARACAPRGAEPRLGARERVARLRQVGGQAADLLGLQRGIDAARQPRLHAQLRDLRLVAVHLLPQLGDAAVEPVIGAPDRVELRIELVGDVELGGEVGRGRGKLRILRGEAKLQHPGIAHHLHLEPAEHRFRGLDFRQFRRRGARGRARREPGREVGGGHGGGLGQPFLHAVGEAFRAGAVGEPPCEFLALRQAEAPHQAARDRERADDLHLGGEHGIRRALVAQDALQLARGVFGRLEHHRGDGGVARRQALRRDQRDHREQQHAGEQHHAPAAQRADQRAEVEALRLDRRRRGQHRCCRPPLGGRSGIGDGTIEHRGATPPGQAGSAPAAGGVTAPGVQPFRSAPVPRGRSVPPKTRP